MNAEITNECYTLLSEIHQCEDVIVAWYSQRDDGRVKLLRDNLKKRRDYLGELTNGIPVTLRVETLFTSP